MQSNLRMKFSTMLENIAINAYQFFEEAKQSGLKNAFRKAFFLNAEIIPVVKKLNDTNPLHGLLDKHNLDLIDIAKDAPYFNYSYRLKSRLMKTKRNVRNGFKGFALVSKNIIVGDIWFVTWETTHHQHLHEDVELLFLNPGEKDVYMFDMFIDPDQRGKNIAIALMGSALYALRQSGHQNAFGFFEMKNIPALWTHRTLKFKEFNHVYFSRIFFKRFSRKK